MKINIVPLGKPRMTQRDRWKERPAVMAYRAYCDELNYALPGYDLPTALHIIFYMPMPKSWSRKKQQSMAGNLHDSKPDIDNLAKGFMDAFKVEDKHVAMLNATKYWAYDAAIVLCLNHDPQRLHCNLLSSPRHLLGDHEPTEPTTLATHKNPPDTTAF